MAITNNLYVIAAICGNFYQESTVNPGVWEDLRVGAPGYGLGQWTNNEQTSRRTALFNYLHDNNYAIDSGEGQLNFLVYEDLWIPSLIQPSAYNTLTDYFNSTSTNLSDLVYEFMYHWEGINDGSYTIRYGAALDFYNAFINDTGVRTPWHSSNSFLRLEYESTDNALLIKDFFTGETPPEPPTPPEPYEPTDEEIVAIFKYLLKKGGRNGVHIII